MFVTNNAEEIGSILRGRYATSSDEIRVPVPIGIPNPVPITYSSDSGEIRIPVPIGIPNPVPVPNLYPAYNESPFNSYLPGPITIKIARSSSSSDTSSSYDSSEFWKRTNAEILKKKSLKEANEMRNKTLLLRNGVDNARHPILRSKNNAAAEEIGHILRGRYASSSDEIRIPVSIKISEPLHVTYSSESSEIVNLTTPVPVPSLNPTTTEATVTYVPDLIPIHTYSDSYEYTSASGGSDYFLKRTKTARKKKNWINVNKKKNKKMVQRNVVDTALHPILRSKSDKQRNIATFLSNGVAYNKENPHTENIKNVNELLVQLLLLQLRQKVLLKKNFKSRIYPFKTNKGDDNERNSDHEEMNDDDIDDGYRNNLRTSFGDCAEHMIPDCKKACLEVLRFVCRTNECSYYMRQRTHLECNNECRKNFV